MSLLILFSLPTLREKVNQLLFTLKEISITLPIPLQLLAVSWLVHYLE
jgi:hypothetical protein